MLSVAKVTARALRECVLPLQGPALVFMHLPVCLSLITATRASAAAVPFVQKLSMGKLALRQHVVQAHWT